MGCDFMYSVGPLLLSTGILRLWHFVTLMLYVVKAVHCILTISCQNCSNFQGPQQAKNHTDPLKSVMVPIMFVRKYPCHSQSL